MFQPVRPFARGRQRRKPELVQSQLIPQKSGHPSRHPTTRPTQSHPAQSDRHHIAIERRGNTILGKQRNLFGLPGAFIEHLNRLAPRRSLAIVDLSKIQHLPLNHATIMNAPVLHNRPCPMSLAVLVAILGAQNMTQTRASPAPAQGAWSALQAFAQTSALQNQALVAIRRPENRKNRIQLVKSG